MIDYLERLRDDSAGAHAYAACGCRSRPRQLCVDLADSTWPEPSAGGHAHFGDAGSARSGAFADRCRSALCAIRGGRETPLFAETVLPVCAPSLLRRAASAEAAHRSCPSHTLLTVDAPALWRHDGLGPWLEATGAGDLRMKNTLRFNHYADAVAAAVAGRGGDRTLSRCWMSI